MCEHVLHYIFRHMLHLLWRLSLVTSMFVRPHLRATAFIAHIVSLTLRTLFDTQIFIYFYTWKLNLSHNFPYRCRSVLSIESVTEFSVWSSSKKTLNLLSFDIFFSLFIWSSTISWLFLPWTNEMFIMREKNSYSAEKCKLVTLWSRFDVTWIFIQTCKFNI